MSSTIAFNSETGILLNEKNDMYLLTDLDALVLKIDQRLKFFKGEWFLDINEGVPYSETIFFGTVDASIVVSLLNNQILQEPDVTGIIKASIQYNKEAHEIYYNATVASIYGDFDIEQVVINGNN